MGSDSTTLDDKCDWPLSLKEDYVPIKFLGRGQFGAVYSAVRKGEKGGSRPEVAIKSVAGETSSAREYAHREVAILKILPSHRNVIKCFDVYADDRDPTILKNFLVLTLARGPMLSELVKKGGGLGITLVREVVAPDLLSAISHCHGHGVIHRDVKPDNCVLVDVREGDDLLHDGKDAIIWSDKVFTEDLWIRRKSYRLVLVDFGFAVALKPSDIKARSSPKADRRGTISSVTARRMSALGSGNYVSPELFKTMREKKKVSKEELKKLGYTPHAALTDHVADYSMQLDSYACGMLLLNIMTGIPPFHMEHEERFVGGRRNRGGMCCFGNANNQTYRTSSELPAEALDLVQNLLQPDPKKRISVRSARDYPWILEVEEEMVEDGIHDPRLEDMPCSRTGEDIQFLDMS